MERNRLILCPDQARDLVKNEQNHVIKLLMTCKSVNPMKKLATEWKAAIDMKYFETPSKSDRLSESLMAVRKQMEMP
jgi:hypothetical protein